VTRTSDILNHMYEPKVDPQTYERPGFNRQPLQSGNRWLGHSPAVV